RAACDCASLIDLGSPGLSEIQRVLQRIARFASTLACTGWGAPASAFSGCDCAGEAASPAFLLLTLVSGAGLAISCASGVLPPSARRYGSGGVTPFNRATWTMCTETSIESA